MKGPFIPVGIAYAAGIVAGNLWALPLPLLLVFGFGALAAAGLASRARFALLSAAVMLTGWSNLVFRTTSLSPFDLRRVVREDTRLATVRGRLIETPRQRIALRGEVEARRTLALLAVTALHIDFIWVPASGSIVVTTPGELAPAFFAGRTVEVEGVIRPPRRAVAEGLFDYRACLRWRGIDYELVASEAADWRLAPHPDDPVRPPLADRFTQWAQRILALGLPVEDEPLRLLWAMTLGWTTALTNEVSEPFMRTGTMHIFAISGLHIVLITGILVALLRVLRVPRSACGWVVVPLIWLYTAATGWQSSAVRSTLMMSVVVIGWALRRPSDLLNSLAAAGFVILVWDPRQLFQASFQLSFFVVLALALLARPLADLQRRWLATDPFLPPELVPAWRRRLETPLCWLTTSLGTSLAAWLGSWPLIAHYFHLMTPGSLLANLAIVPLSSLALMSNLGSLLCGDWLPGLTTLFNHAAWFWMACTVRLSEWIADWPGTWFYIRSPGLLISTAYYLALIGGMTPALRQGWRWLGSVGAPATAVGLSLAGHWWAERNAVTVTVLALRSGSALYVNAPGRRNDVLIDCGDEAAAAGVVRPFLQAQGVNRLPRLVLTHGDVRHVGGAETITAAFRPRRIAVSAAPTRSPSLRRLAKTLAATPEVREQVQGGDTIAGWTVAHPSGRSAFAQADDNAIVLHGEFQGTRLLLLSDLGRLGQEAVLRTEATLRAGIVVTGMPAGSEPLGANLPDAIQPSVIIVQDGEYPAKARMGAALRSRLAIHGAPVLSTTEDGTITIRLRPGRWEAHTMNGRLLDQRVQEPGPRARPGQTPAVTSTRPTRPLSLEPSARWASALWGARAGRDLACVACCRQPVSGRGSRPADRRRSRVVVAPSSRESPGAPRPVCGPPPSSRCAGRAAPN